MKKAIEISHTKQTDVVEGYYEVESIEKIRSFGKYDLKFLIKWKGWSESDNTWEPFQNVRSCFFNIKEFYAKSIDNKKITNSDAWKMFIGCLKRENLIDEQGRFKEVVKRKYNKKKKNEDNLSEELDDEKKSTENDQRTSTQSDLKQMNIKIEQQEQEDSSKMDSKIESKTSQQQNKDLKKAKKMNKKRENPKKENGEEIKLGQEDKEANIEIKQKRKYKKRQQLVENDEQNDETLLKKRKFKRTYSSLINKKQKKVKLNENEEIKIPTNINNQQEFEMKLEEPEYHLRINQQESHSNNNLNSSQIEMAFNQNDLFDKRYDQSDKQIEKNDLSSEYQSSKNKIQQEILNKELQSFEDSDQIQEKEDRKKLEFYFEEAEDTQKEQKLKKLVIEEQKKKFINEYDSPLSILQNDKLNIQQKSTENDQANIQKKKKKKKQQQVRFQSNQGIDDKQQDSFQQLQMVFQNEKQSNSRESNFDDNNNLYSNNDNGMISDILVDSCEIYQGHKQRISNKKICKISSEEQIYIQKKNPKTQLDVFNQQYTNNEVLTDKISNINDINSESLSQYTTKNTNSKLDIYKEQESYQDLIYKSSKQKFNRFQIYHNQIQNFPSNSNQYNDKIYQQKQQYFLPHEQQYQYYTYVQYPYGNMPMQQMYTPHQQQFIPMINKQNMWQYKNQQEFTENKQKQMNSYNYKQDQNQINLQTYPHLNNQINKQVNNYIYNQDNSFDKNQVNEKSYIQRLKDNSNSNSYINYQTNNQVNNKINNQVNDNKFNIQLNSQINGSNSQNTNNQINKHNDVQIKKEQTKMQPKYNNHIETIDIDNDSQENDDNNNLIQNNEINFKQQNEKNDKEKCTKIRLIKKSDSIEIYESKPFNNDQQYIDELQKKKLKFTNYNDIQGSSDGLSKNLNELNNVSQPQLKKQYQKYKKDIEQLQNPVNNNQIGKNSSQKQSLQSNGPNVIPQFNDQTYEQFLNSQFQEVKHLKNPKIIDPQKSINCLYEGNLALKDEPLRIIAMDIHPFLIDQYIFKVCWQPRKKKDQLISSWVEGDKLKLKYPHIVFEFYESYIRFID